jgi:hypothetical protein
MYFNAKIQANTQPIQVCDHPVAIVAVAVEIRPGKSQLWLSCIKQWRRRDHGGRKGYLGLVIRHLPDDEKKVYVDANRAGLDLREKTRLQAKQWLRLVP